MTEPTDHHQEKPARLYRSLMERAKQFLPHGTHAASGGTYSFIDRAVEKTVELEEAGQEEAERIGGYLRKDVQAAAEYLADTEKELADWLRFDIQLVEDRVLDVFSLMVDHTRAALMELESRVQNMSEWHTGETTGPGTLTCVTCGKSMSFHQPGRVPPCPSCHATIFKRELE